MAYNLNLSSVRSQKARLSLLLNAPLAAFLLMVIGALNLGLGAYLYWQGSAMNGIFLGLAIAAFVVWQWRRGDLQKLDTITPKVGEGINVDNLLDIDALGRLKSTNASAHDIWLTIKNTHASVFFQNRYQLHPDIFEQLLPTEGSGTDVWELAEQLRRQYQANSYSIAIVIVALLKSIPKIDQKLLQMQMELKEVETGLHWYEDLMEKIVLAKQQRFFGGFARDWAYGYTPLLRHLGHNISEEVQYTGFFRDTTMHHELVHKAVQAFVSGNNAVALIGDVGVGKTTCVYTLAEYLLTDKAVDNKLRYNQVVTLSATSLLSQARGEGSLESLVAKILNEAHRAKNIILFFDDAHVFFSQGTGTVDLTNVLRPVIEAGTVRLIFSFTPKEWQSLSATRTGLLPRIQPLTVQPADEAATLHVLQDQVLELEHGSKIAFTYQALREAYRLASRYVTDLAMPGAALQILEQATTHVSEGLVTAEDIKRTVESSSGVKLQTARADESEKLLHLEDELHKYVINQKQAVTVIANALRRSRSGVGNRERPIGTFLFLGPTGVGKTELSKALARVYFGDVDALIRVDMNQYVQSSDVSRLITPMEGDQLGFLGQIRKRPFSVVLLDEIEKAHPQVVNALLQMLDEGVMNDSDSKRVSFKDAIVIATSNAGADEIRRKIGAGEDVTKQESAFVDYLINKGVFAPELVNRFDEVVLFRPLNQDELMKVLDLIVDGINKTLDTHKISIRLTDDAKVWLVVKGNDPRLGARPMRRVVQRYVENIIAKRLLSNDTHPGAEIVLDIGDLQRVASAESEEEVEL